ncbi:hypothetical protein Ahy_A01g001480 [Arachis hypogaea]|uniref:Uncharacterized protein n=1 Tax=Arachis hypogaea TaxID=3818 RepID=A0A445ENP0_ARAHY|nr:hypothetical protein Ahy_A01g001480 [Arachis hypogaea]
MVGVWQLMEKSSLEVMAVQHHTIYYKDQQVYNLNELEYIDGEVWANVFTTHCIVRISRNDGRVLGWILLPNLTHDFFFLVYIQTNYLVLMTWDHQQKRIFVTGKLWPKLYEIKVVPINKPIDEGIIEQLCLHQPFKFT